MLQKCFNLISTYIQTLWVWIKSHIFVCYVLWPYNSEPTFESECETIIELIWNQKCLCSIFLDWVLSSNTHICASTRVNNIIYLVKAESFSINLQALMAIRKSEIILLISLKIFYNIRQPLNELRKTQKNLILDAFWYLLESYFLHYIFKVSWNIISNPFNSWQNKMWWYLHWWWNK